MSVGKRHSEDVSFFIGSLKDCKLCIYSRTLLLLSYILHKLWQSMCLRLNAIIIIFVPLLILHICFELNNSLSIFVFNKPSCVTSQSTNIQINPHPAANIYQIFRNNSYKILCYRFFFYYNKINIIWHKKRVELKFVLKQWTLSL